MDLSKIKKDFLGQRQERSFELSRKMEIDDDERTVRVAFASEKPIEHWFGNLILTMSDKAMRSERLKNGAAYLLDHNRTKQIGVVTEYAIEKQVARAKLKFSRSKLGEEIFQDVKDGIRQNISVGFVVHELHLESEEKGKPPVYRSDDWEVLEISTVSIPADISVGVGRSLENKPSPKKDLQTEQTMAKENEEQEEVQTIEKPKPSASELLIQRTKEFIDTAQLFSTDTLKFEDVARDYALDEGKSLDDLKKHIREERAKTPKPDPKTPEDAVREAGGTQLARTIRRFGKIKHFADSETRSAEEKAHRFGMWLLAGPLGRGSDKVMEFCRTEGLIRAQSESVNEDGGYLVPDEFGNDLIDLREMFGVFRRNAKIVPMTSDVRSDPRRTSGLTAYFVGEGEAGTESKKGWDRVQLVAKKLMVLGRYSSEVSEDSVISLGDDLAGEIAYAFANKEDECGFNGDGTSTYGGIVGVNAKIKGLSGTIANIAGLHVGTGNAYSELTLADFEAVVGLLPQYADTPMAKWFVHRSFYYNVMVKVMLASGGVTAAEIEGQRSKSFLGYEVEFSQVQPKTEANSQVCALLGDLAKAASFGSRRDTRIDLSEHSRFSTDEIEVRGTERIDINVHDVGNATATASDKQPGPVVGLITAAS